MEDVIEGLALAACNWGYMYLSGAEGLKWIIIKQDKTSKQKGKSHNGETNHFLEP